MSCSVCRLPFLPDRQVSNSPLPAHFAPSGVLTTSQTRYFERANVFGELVPGFLIQNGPYYSSNMIGNTPSAVPICLNVQWEQITADATLIAMHSACLALFRRALGVEENTRENLLRLATFERAMGRPAGGDAAGRWNDVNYEVVGDQVDTRALWRPGNDLGLNVFNWRGLAQQYPWLVSRPDVFPRFFPLPVAKTDDTIECGSDILTRQPTDVLRAIAAQLDVRTLTQLAATCRFIRNLAKSDWQPLARRLALSLQWAVPTSSELKAVSEQSRERLAQPQAEGDWLLYLGHVHRTNSMRVRRWIWAICGDIKRVADVKLESAGLTDPDSPAMQQIDAKFNTLWTMFQTFHGRGTTTDQLMSMMNSAQGRMPTL
ncbi:hypothetical protein EXIGLDRAFT_695476 [Exidia glandulosa HHB12029]|uniref:F-box domain-containing protein n=1 Tax=Exidia glandulosa HHB12029 TaxID=1314781 RepID=A0A165FUE4_EXIGL|nr:hypothetical protein EXIGLDRAFT_695476 [Exidia glandulosa HHB12029]